MLFHALRAAPHGRQILVAALGAGARHRGLVAAMVALQAMAASVGAMQHGKGGTARAVADPGAGLAVQHRRIAAPVQEDQRLFLAFQPLADGLEQLRRHAMLHLQPAGVDQPHRRQRAGPRPARQGQAQVAAALGVLPGFQRRRGRSEHDRDVQVVRAPHREVARRITQAVLLLVRRIVFLVHHDQAQFAQGREDGHARAQQHAGLAALGAGPGLHAFAVGQAAVHDGEPFGAHQGLQAGAQRALELRRQVDFGDHQQHLASGRQHLFGGPQVHLGLAAARHPMQQDRLEPGQRADGVHRGALGVVQLGRLVGGGPRADGLALAPVQPRHRTARGTLALVRRGLAQGRRQRGQHHFTQGPLVVVRGKPRHPQPVFGQRRQVIQHFFDGPDLLGVE
ncbi:hypothetical protein D3C85_678340 [compost metagenome]